MFMLMMIRVDNVTTEQIRKLNRKINESRCEKTGLRDFRPGPTQTGTDKKTEQKDK